MDNNRKILDFNAEWLYSPDDHADAQNPKFDDSAFLPVTVPHANKVLEKHKGDDFQNQIESYRFISWYRKHFTVSDDCRGMCIIAGFQGVATVAEVYVNGELAGTHKGAYTGFSFDITDYVKYGDEDNVIAVRVDSTKHGDVPPEGGDVDYCIFGGIVRNVTLTIVNKVYVKDTFITTPGLSAESGNINHTTLVENNADEIRNVAVLVNVYDSEGKEAASSKSDIISINAKESMTVENKTTEIENPCLWSVDHPYLYTVKIQLLENGEVIDTTDTKIGLRWFEFTEKGFYLNGEKLKLRGVNRHEQWPWQGRAVPDKLQIRYADMIKDTGFNA
ncbi:MAG: hypothetical protein K2K09_05130, partial [Lachnospiraceae bacterium]|nr:hypothetical protein [Lachnospiraceae bacterium]